jgi:hypothetical protein
MSAPGVQVGVLGGQFDRLAVVAGGFGEPSLFVVDLAAIEPGMDVVRLEFHHAAEILDARSNCQP